jgi:hypothetical protein
VVADGWPAHMTGAAVLLYLNSLTALNGQSLMWTVRGMFGSFPR